MKIWGDYEILVFPFFKQNFCFNPNIQDKRYMQWLIIVAIEHDMQRLKKTLQ